MDICGEFFSIFFLLARKKLLHGSFILVFVTKVKKQGSHKKKFFAQQFCFVRENTTFGTQHHVVNMILDNQGFGEARERRGGGRRSILCVLLYS